MELDGARKAVIFLLVICETEVILLYALHSRYRNEADARRSSLSETNATESERFESKYPMFQDVHVMLFIGFGFLMTFLKRYAYSAVGFNFLLSAYVIQLAAILQQTVFDHEWIGLTKIGFNSLVNADVIAVGVMISFGAVLGKYTLPLYIYMAYLETHLLIANEYICIHLFEAVDAGDSMLIHVFGAYFGLAFSFALGFRVYPNIEDNKMEAPRYQSDINAMIGSLFLWVFWPSFNGGQLTGDQRERAVINTYLSLAASCVTTFMMSLFTSPNYKFNMMHVQNATLAGGVCIGSIVNMMVRPFGAIIIGSFAGILSTLGYRYIQGFLLKKLHIHDTCGVHNLHGMPGVVAGILSAILAGCASKEDYGDNLSKVFPAMESGRTPAVQAGFQMAALGVTLLISIVGGLIGGFVPVNICMSIKASSFIIPPTEFFKDDVSWELQEDNDEP